MFVCVIHGPRDCEFRSRSGWFAVRQPQCWNQPGAKSWPIVGATFILVHAVPDDPAATAESLKFFSWAYKNGGKMAEELDYVPLPPTVVALIKKTWANEIKGADGKPLLD